MGCTRGLLIVIVLSSTSWTTVQVQSSAHVYTDAICYAADDTDIGESVGTSKAGRRQDQHEDSSVFLFWVPCTGCDRVHV